ncbi:uncharacterized protein (TIGR03086 family) [Motilibacter peucedani]|uniref:Uncharacterized protein (TIGR03086 family) n=1 Tax=Motilibacter peucedani TaxID=598650 RepID=A0A420XSU8_9ACTN|nr:TIGR03086 family metal-binding protein [Motilibacter peucedani]RKS77944.1 uncharacterized protein (TIGR03086 family) [Motilibacter peucedani]
MQAQHPTAASVEVELDPATRKLAELVQSLSDQDLDAPTPCEGIAVAALVAHIDDLALAFAAAARKQPTGSGTPLEEIVLQDGWRDRVPERLSDLARAWRDPAAWEGTTSVGGVEMQARDAAAAAVDEVLIHGWDLATAVQQPFDADGPATATLVAFAYGWVGPFTESAPDGIPGLFRAAVQVPADAPLLHRLLGATGRVPAAVS